MMLPSWSRTTSDPQAVSEVGKVPREARCALAEHICDPEYISDPADERLDDYRGLNDPQRRREIEAARGIFVAEGLIVVSRLLSPACRYRVSSVLLRVRGVPTPATAALVGTAQKAGARVYLADQEILEAVAGFAFHRGVLAVGLRARGQASFEELASSGVPLAILEGVSDNENIGALFRNAAALGVGGILLGPGCADPLYRRSLRVSMGHALTLPFGRASQWPDELGAIAERGLAVVALSPRADATPLEDVVHEVGKLPAAGQQPGALAILIGAEGAGLSEAALAGARYRARIPMPAGVDSLNLATAAAISFYRLLGPVAGRHRAEC